MTKEQAIAEIESYVDKSKYTVNLGQLNHITSLAIQDINNVKADEPVGLIDRFVTEYKKIIDAIQTDSEIEIVILEERKRKAVITINSYDDISRYNEPEKTQMTNYIQSGLQAVNLATNKQEIDATVTQTVDSIIPLARKEYQDKKMFLNSPTYDMVKINRGADPDLYSGESDHRLIQLYFNQFVGLTYPGTSAPRPSLKLFTMSKEEVN